MRPYFNIEGVWLVGNKPAKGQVGLKIFAEIDSFEFLHTILNVLDIIINIICISNITMNHILCFE